MNKAILLPGLLSTQPYQNVRWKSIPSEWQDIYQHNFKRTLFDDYYSGHGFRSSCFRHIVYIYSYIKAKKRSSNDYYAFSLSILACAIEQNIINFEDMVNIYLDLEGKLFQSRSLYKMYVVLTSDPNLHEKFSILNPCFVGKNYQIYHILDSDECKFISLMKSLSIDYVFNSVEYPFHSQACPLHSNSICQDNIKINSPSYSRNIFSLGGMSIHEVLCDMNQIFTSQIYFTPKLQAYDYIGEVASRSHLIPLLKDVFPGIEDFICFEVLDK
jgi:hypothetical protein